MAGCLRNATAAGRWLADQGLGTPARPVTVVAAGDRWPDGSLRPALEDLLGAGAVIAALQELHAGPLSPEAVAAVAGFRASADVAAVVAASVSGQELLADGFADDVAIATELDASQAVPVRTNAEAAFTAAT